MAQTKAAQALKFVREIAQTSASAIDVPNAILGNGGKFGELFPTRAERQWFSQTPEYQEIRRIRNNPATTAEVARCQVILSCRCRVHVSTST